CVMGFHLIVHQLVATLLRTGKKSRLIAGQFQREQLGNSGVIRFLRLHLPNHEHGNKQRQQTGNHQSEVLNYGRNDGVAMALLSDLTPILFQLFMACVNGRLLLVELGCQFHLCRDQFTTCFCVAFDQFFRRFGELVAFFDDGLALIGHAFVLPDLLSDGLLSHFGKPFVGRPTASSDGCQKYHCRDHRDAAVANHPLHEHFSIG
ncbi:MAG: hypothetical protein WBH28_13555, partial [Fuerstiella sp.]